MIKQEIADLLARAGQTAQDAGDTATAITAYKTFLKLAPNDPLSASAKKALKQLQGSSTAAHK